LLIADEDDDSITTSLSPILNFAPEGFSPQLSLNALVGMPTSETMRLFDTINNHQVLIFVDSGSTHNFIQSRITKFLALQSALTPPVKVLVGNDTTMDYDTSCPQIPMLIQGHRFMVDFFALPHSGADVALGVQWLCEL